MTMPPDKEAQILRYHHVEKWHIGTIARQLHVHHGSVERVLRQAGLPRIGVARPSCIDAYLSFIHQTLEKFPSLTARYDQSPPASTRSRSLPAPGHTAGRTGTG